MNHKLRGKGSFIWYIDDVAVENGDVVEIAGKAKVADMTHVIMKVAGMWEGVAVKYNVDSQSRTSYHNYTRDTALELVQALKDVGVGAWGWQFVYGNSPVTEANVALERISELGLDGFVVNAETAYKNKPTSANTYMTALREGVGPDFPIALSSFRYPEGHPSFPWDEFLSKCDVNMPQVYWIDKHNPAEQLIRTISEFTSINYGPEKITTIPTGAAFYSSKYDWQPTVADLEEFVAEAKKHNLPGINFWRWGHIKSKGYWDFVRTFDFPIETEITLEERIRNIEDDTLSLENKVSALSSDLDTAEKKIETINGGLSELSDQAKSNDSLSRKNQSDISYVKDEITKLNTETSNLKNGVNQISGQISEIATDISNLKDLESRVSRLEKKLNLFELIRRLFKGDQTPQ